MYCKEDLIRLALRGHQSSNHDTQIWVLQGRHMTMAQLRAAQDAVRSRESQVEEADRC